MKALVVLLTILAGVWLIKRSMKRRQESAEPPVQRSATPKQLPMLACAHCGMHVPAHEMLKGQGGKVYCSLAHQQAHQAAQGPSHGRSR